MKLNSTGRRCAVWLALFTVILGAKLWVIQVYATPIPYWDQWDEARLLFKPWLEGQLTWHEWFAPHNEHRIFFTRVLDLGVVWLNGQWDPRLQMTINAFIHSGYACGLVYCVWVFAGRNKSNLPCLWFAPFFAFPFAMDNTIHGFQSQMYFLSIFTVIAILGLGFAAPGSRGWWGGLAAAALSLVTMGSGLLAALTVLGLILLRLLKTKRISWAQLITTGCSLAVVTAGLGLNVAGGHDQPFQAKSFLAFVTALGGNLAWPFEDTPVRSLFVCLPLIILAIEYFRADFKAARAAEFILAFGFWGFLQAAALAYGRVNQGNSSRYLDTLCTLPIASLASLFVLWSGGEFRRFSKVLTGWFTVVWTGFIFFGLGQISHGLITDRSAVEGHLPWTRAMGVVQAENVRAFVATDDPVYLQNKPAWHIPYWSSGLLIDSLRDRKLARLLPIGCRPPLTMSPDPTIAAAFIADGYPAEMPKREFTRTWGNYTTNKTAWPSHFVSEPMTTPLAKLAVQLCCGPNTAGLNIQLLELSTNHRFPLTPQCSGRWQTLIITAPTSPFRLEITSQNQAAWVAVGDINELGRLASGALWLTAQGAKILLAGLLLCALLAALTLTGERWLSWRAGAVDFSVLLLALTALACVWPARNFDPEKFTRDLHQQWAAYFESKNDLRSAELHLHESLWLDPHDAKTFLDLARVLLHDPQPDPGQARVEARQAYQAASRLQPDSPEIKNQLRAVGALLGR